MQERLARQEVTVRGNIVDDRAAAAAADEQREDRPEFQVTNQLLEKPASPDQEQREKEEVGEVEEDKNTCPYSFRLECIPSQFKASCYISSHQQLTNESSKNHHLINNNQPLTSSLFLSRWPISKPTSKTQPEPPTVCGVSSYSHSNLINTDNNNENNNHDANANANANANADQIKFNGTIGQRDALLVADDDHYGDHLEQRQTSDRVGKLRSASHTNNDLANNMRILSDPMAIPDSSNGGRSSDGHRTSTNDDNDHENNKTTDDSRRRDKSSASSSSASTTDRSHRKFSNNSGGIDDNDDGQNDSQRKTSPPSIGIGSPVVGNSPSGQQMTPATKQQTKKSKNSLWQNSLSRMSNKFSIFGGSSSSQSNTLKHSSSQKQVEKHDQQQQQHSVVALDAWIEAKVDFDEDETNDELSLPQRQQQQQNTADLSLSSNKVTNDETTNSVVSQSTTSESISTLNNNSKQPITTTTTTAAASDDHEISSSSSTTAAAATATGTASKVVPKNNQQENQSDGRYSLLQFALYNFREAIDKYSLESRANKHLASDQLVNADTGTLRGSLKLIETLRRSRATTINNNDLNNHQQQQQQQQSGTTTKKQSSKRSSHSKVTANDPKTTATATLSATSGDWTWRELAQMVKFTAKPIKYSLLKLPSADLNKRAVDCFASIMQYMGDLPGNHNHNGLAAAATKLNEVECVYLILMNCHNYPILRDEIYCQLVKQTTNNRSEQNQDSCLRGWRLFSMIAAYFDCSDLLKPYLLKYLETAAYDKRRAYCSVALICLQNIRKTFKFGGRKNVPSIEEIAATSAGRNSKRQIYRLPGGTERVINTKSSTVVEDIIYEICSSMLNVTDSDEMLEFSLYCIADGDLYTMPLNRDEYILDITTELIKNHQQYFLIFCRSIWYYPLRLDSKLYIEVIFNQIAPDYLEGLLLVLPDLQQHHQQQQQQHNHHHHHHQRRRLESASSSFTTTTTSTLQTNNNNRLNESPSSQQTMVNHEDRQQQNGASNNSSKYQLRLRAKLVKEIARIAALLHRASGTDYMPHRDEVKYLLPKPIIAAMKQSSSSNNVVVNQQQKLTSSTQSRQTYRSTTPIDIAAMASTNSHLLMDEATAPITDEVNELLSDELNQLDETVLMTPQKWVELVQENWREMSAFDTLDAKAQFLEIVRHWPLFGSSFFAIKLIQRDLIQPMEFILALNKLGIQMLDSLTHQTIHRYPFNEVISTRKVRSEDGALFLDLKCGNLMKRTIIRIQTDQAHEISRLIRQYIDIELIQQKQQQQTNHQQQQTATTMGIEPSLAGSDSDRASSSRYQENPTISS